MRKLLLLAAGIGATLFVQRRAAEAGVTPGALVSNVLGQALGRLTPEAGVPPAKKA